MELIKLEIVTPEGMFFDDEVKLVTVPGTEGEFGILAGHAALISFLTLGTIRIEDKRGIALKVEISGGYIKVEEKNILCMIDSVIVPTQKGK